MNSDTSENVVRPTRRRAVVLALGAVVVLALVAGLSVQRLSLGPDEPSTSITFQLSWVHNGAYAGYYAADRLGYYADAGLELAFIEGGPRIDPVQSVVEGRAQFGGANANLLIKSRAEGKPVRAIATLHQLNPVVFITLQDSGITHPKQFAGKSIQSSVQNLPILHAVTNRFGIGPGQYEAVHRLDFDRLYSGDANVLVAFRFKALKKMSRDGYKVNVMYPDNYGVHFYQNSIFTTDDIIAEQPDLVRRFLRATLERGWAYAVQNPQLAGPMTAEYGPNIDPIYETAMLADILPLIKTGEVEIGWMEPGIWDAMTQNLQQMGVLAQPVDPTQVYTMGFLREIYDTEE